MEKALNILVVALMAAAGLQIAAVNFMFRGVNYIELLKGVDFSALQTAFTLMPLLF